MKTFYYGTFIASLFSVLAIAQTSYINTIRQYQMPSDVQWDIPSQVASSGSKLSDFIITAGGARFELHTISSSSAGLQGYLLGSTFVGSYIPQVTLVVRSQDGSGSSPRTRADRPFFVDITVSGLRTGVTDPLASKRVNVFHHTQAYGEGGSEIGLDLTKATLLSQTSIDKDGTQTTTYAAYSNPGDDRRMIRGQERFSVWSLDDYQVPAQTIASQTIHIWPEADGEIFGLVNKQAVRGIVPPLTFVTNNLYPNSTLYAQIYKGSQVLGTTGVIMDGALTLKEELPQNKTIYLSDYDSKVTEDGIWTIELLTVTPFDTVRLDYVEFEVDRTIKLNAAITTSN